MARPAFMGDLRPALLSIAPNNMMLSVRFGNSTFDLFSMTVFKLRFPNFL
jgi:hypothetical protein